MFKDILAAKMSAIVDTATHPMGDIHLEHLSSKVSKDVCFLMTSDCSLYIWLAAAAVG